VVLNPRRHHYDMTAPDIHAEQVAWEYRHLRLARAILFWFPACDPRVTVQPITLLELGTAIAEARLCGRTIAIGADNRYPRRIDLELQLAHALPQHPVHPTLRDVTGALLTRA
jgi:hypothetical protein